MIRRKCLRAMVPTATILLLSSVAAVAAAFDHDGWGRFLAPPRPVDRLIVDPPIGRTAIIGPCLSPGRRDRPCPLRAAAQDGRRHPPGGRLTLALGANQPQRRPVLITPTTLFGD